MATTPEQSVQATPLPPKRTGLLPPVSQAFVQTAFESKPRCRIGTDDMLAIRDALSKLLASSGGRPGIAGQTIG